MAVGYLGQAWCSSLLVVCWKKRGRANCAALTVNCWWFCTLHVKEYAGENLCDPRYHTSHFCPIDGSSNLQCLIQGLSLCFLTWSPLSCSWWEGVSFGPSSLHLPLWIFRLGMQGLRSVYLENENVVNVERWSFPSKTAEWIKWSCFLMSAYTVLSHGNTLPSGSLGPRESLVLCLRRPR